jgi:beta-galactosidase
MSPNSGLRYGAIVLGALALIWGATSITTPRSTLTIDASNPPPAPQPLPFETGGQSPNGHTLSINSRYLQLDNNPWLPVMGEFHFARYPADEWEQEILKMKAGGVGIVSTYIFWIHHEEIEGEFDWSGQRDLRRFIELCAKHGMYAWVRVGPWAHGEVRNGGFPDWLLRKSAVRQNDPAYLKYVSRFFGEIGTQLHGLFWKDGGPIIGVQLENEYHARGFGQGAEHILMLKQLSRDANLEAPFYTITGWDAAAVPERGVVPVFGGYTDAFWDRHLTELPPNPNYFFTPIRCEENVGNDLHSKHPEIDARFTSYPFLTAEMGGGMELAYHRRPLMSADDIAAPAVVKLGSGITLYGYYMFHGGTNPDGKRTTLQESQATGYPNDMPVKTYDFQAPLGEFGQMNASFRNLKTIHMFLHDFGTDLAPMTTSFPEKLPSSRQDSATPRATARTDGRRGYIFLNNFQRNYPLPDRKDFQVRLKLASGTIDVPNEVVTIPSSAYTFWPVNLDMDGALLEYATAQPLSKLDDPATYVFLAWPGIAPEFAFRAADIASIQAPHSQIRREEGRVYVDKIALGVEPAIELRSRQGQTVRILVLNREQARNTWKATVSGKERLILSEADVFFEADSIHLRSTEPDRISFAIFPKPETTIQGFTDSGREGIFERYCASVQQVNIPADIRKLSDAGKTAPVKMGKEVAMAPGDAEFASAGRWSIRVPNLAGPGMSNVYLRIAYEGDVARVYDAGKLMTDDFYKGTPWWIGLRRISRAGLERGIELRILPLRQDAPIYLPSGARPAQPPGGERVSLKEVRVVPEYEVVARLNP